jgi:glutamate carboxypeptidase
MLLPRMFVGLAISLTCMATAASGRSPLTNVETRIASHVDRDNEGALGLLEEVVNINSGTLNTPGVRAVGDRFRRELDALGFSTRWIDGTAFQRAGHLLAEHHGRGPSVLLIGHLDTVFEKDSPFQRFERTSPVAAKGPGIIDMKGGDVIIIHALKALRAAGVLDTLRITVIMTGDEEDVGSPRQASRESLRAAAHSADMAIGFEDGSGDPRRAVIARRGVTVWRLRVTAKSAHSSQVFTDDVGAGAIFEASRLLRVMYERLSRETLLTFNPGVIVGGTEIALDPEGVRGTASGKTNVVAANAVVTGDLRSISSPQLETAKATMRAIAAEPLPHTASELTFNDSYPPMAPTDGNQRLLHLYDEISRDLGTGGVEATDPRAAGAADIAFAAESVPMALDGIGLMGKDDHTDRETADLATLASQTKRAALLLYRLSKGMTNDD